MDGKQLGSIPPDRPGPGASRATEDPDPYREDGYYLDLKTPVWDENMPYEPWPEFTDDKVARVLSNIGHPPHEGMLKRADPESHLQRLISAQTTAFKAAWLRVLKRYDSAMKGKIDAFAALHGAHNRIRVQETQLRDAMADKEIAQSRLEDFHKDVNRIEEVSEEQRGRIVTLEEEKKTLVKKEAVLEKSYDKVLKAQDTQLKVLEGIVNDWATMTGMPLVDLTGDPADYESKFDAIRNALEEAAMEASRTTARYEELDKNYVEIQKAYDYAFVHPGAHEGIPFGELKSTFKEKAIQLENQKQAMQAEFNAERMRARGELTKQAQVIAKQQAKVEELRKEADLYKTKWGRLQQTVDDLKDKLCNQTAASIFDEQEYKEHIAALEKGILELDGIIAEVMKSAEEGTVEESLQMEADLRSREAAQMRKIQAGGEILEEIKAKIREMEKQIKSPSERVAAAQLGSRSSFIWNMLRHGWNATVGAQKEANRAMPSLADELADRFDRASEAASGSEAGSPLEMKPPGPRASVSLADELAGMGDNGSERSSESQPASPVQGQQTPAQAKTSLADELAGLGDSESEKSVESQPPSPVQGEEQPVQTAPVPEEKPESPVASEPKSPTNGKEEASETKPELPVEQEAPESKPESPAEQELPKGQPESPVESEQQAAQAEIPKDEPASPAKDLPGSPVKPEPESPAKTEQEVPVKSEQALPTETKSKSPARSKPKSPASSKPKSPASSDRRTPSSSKSKTSAASKLQTPATSKPKTPARSKPKTTKSEPKASSPAQTGEGSRFVQELKTLSDSVNLLSKQFKEMEQEGAEIQWKLSNLHRHLPSQHQTFPGVSLNPAKQLELPREPAGDRLNSNIDAEESLVIRSLEQAIDLVPQLTAAPAEVGAEEASLHLSEQLRPIVEDIRTTEISAPAEEAVSTLKEFLEESVAEGIQDRAEAFYDAVKEYEEGLKRVLARERYATDKAGVDNELLKSLDDKITELGKLQTVQAQITDEYKVHQWKHGHRPLSPIQATELWRLTSKLVENTRAKWNGRASTTRWNAAAVNKLVGQIEKLTVDSYLAERMQKLRDGLAQQNKLWDEFNSIKLQIQHLADALKKQRDSLSRLEGKGRFSTSPSDTEFNMKFEISLERRERRLRRAINSQDLVIETAFSRRTTTADFINRELDQSRRAAEKLLTETLIKVQSSRPLDPAAGGACFCTLLHFYFPRAYYSILNGGCCAGGTAKSHPPSSSSHSTAPCGGHHGHGPLSAQGRPWTLACHVLTSLLWLALLLLTQPYNLHALAVFVVAFLFNLPRAALAAVGFARARVVYTYTLYRSRRDIFVRPPKRPPPEFQVLRDQVSNLLPVVPQPSVMVGAVVTGFVVYAWLAYVAVVVERRIWVGGNEWRFAYLLDLMGAGDANMIPYAAWSPVSVDWRLVVEPTWAWMEDGVHELFFKGVGANAARLKAIGV